MPFTVIKMLGVEKVGAHAAFWENLWAKTGPNRASIGSSEKRIMLDYQMTDLSVKVLRLSLWKFRASMRRTPEDTRGAS